MWVEIVVDSLLAVGSPVLHSVQKLQFYLEKEDLCPSRET